MLFIIQLYCLKKKEGSVILGTCVGKKRLGYHHHGTDQFSLEKEEGSSSCVQRRWHAPARSPQGRPVALLQQQQHTPPR